MSVLFWTYIPSGNREIHTNTNDNKNKQEGGCDSSEWKHPKSLVSPLKFDFNPGPVLLLESTLGAILVLTWTCMNVR